MSYLYLFLAIVAEVTATSALKAAEGFTRPLPSVVVVVGYGLAFYFLSIVLKEIPVGIAYAIWSGAGIVLISLVGWVLFNQRIDLPAAIGMALIVAGIAVMQIFSKAVPH